MTFEESYRNYKKKQESSGKFAMQSKNEETEQNLSFEESYRRWKAPQIKKEIAARTDSLIKNSNTFLQNARTRSNNTANTYVSDSGEWLSKITGQHNDLNQESGAIKNMLGKYRKYLDSDWANQIDRVLTDGTAGRESVISSYQKENDYWNSFANEEEYNTYTKVMKAAQSFSPDQLSSRESVENLMAQTEDKDVKEYLRQTRDNLMTMDETKAAYTNAANSDEKLYFRSLYDRKWTEHNAEILKNTKMDGENISVYEAIQSIAGLKKEDTGIAIIDAVHKISNLDNEARIQKIKDKVESLGINFDDFYSFMTGEKNYSLKNNYDLALSSANHGLATFNKGLAATADLLLGKPLAYFGWKDNPISEANRYYTDSLNNASYDMQRNVDKMGGKEGISFLANALSGTVATLPDAILALMSGGASSAASASQLSTKAAYATANTIGRAGITVQSMMKNPFYWTSFAREYGMNYEEAVNSGANETVAMFASTISSLINAGIEIGFDGGSGIQGLPDELLNGDKNAIRAWVESAIEEGGEELLQGAVNNLVAKFSYDPDKPWTSYKTGEGVFDLASQAEEFGMGAFVGGILGGGQTLVNVPIQYQADQYNAKMNNIGKYTDTSVIDSVKQLGLSTDPNSKAYHMAQGLSAESKNLYKGATIAEVLNEVYGNQTVSVVEQMLKDGGYEGKNLTETAREFLSSAENSDMSRKVVRAIGDNVELMKVWQKLTNSALIDTDAIAASLKEAGIQEKHADVLARTMALSAQNKTSDSYLESFLENEKVAEIYKEVQNEIEQGKTAERFIPNEENRLGAKRIEEQLRELAEKRVENEEKLKLSKDGTKNDLYSIYNEETIEDRIFRKASGEDAKIKKIADIQDGNIIFEMTDGSTERLSDLTFEDAKEAALLEEISQMNIDAKTAENLYINLWNGTATTEEYTKGIQQAYLYGLYNMKKDMEMTDFLFNLTDDQKKYAYYAGRMAAEKEATAAKKDHSTKETSGKRAEKTKGRVRYIDKTEEILAESQTELQKRSIEGIHKIADALNLPITFYATEEHSGLRYTEINGKKIGANGFYDPNTGEFYLDINAGLDGKGTILFTASHELVHMIKEWSPEKFKILADFLVEKYGEKNISVEKMVHRQIAKAEKLGREISFEEAFEEFVADSMETMLSDGKIIQTLQELKHKDESLWKKIKGYIKNLAEKIHSLYKDLSPDSEEGRYVSEMKESLDELQKLFTEGLIDAGKNYNNKKGLNEETNHSNIKMQIREEFKQEYDNWNKKDPRIKFNLGTISEILVGLGIEKKTIQWDASKIIKIKEKHVEMTNDIIKQVPNILEYPIVIMRSKSKENRLTMFGEVYSNNKPILAVLELMPTDRRGYLLDEFKIASAYGKDNAQNFINSSDILYIDSNKKRVNSWEKRTRLQLPVGISTVNSNDSISERNPAVNNQYMQNSKINSEQSVKYSEREDSDYKQKQLDIILSNNPAPNSYLTWIRSKEDIKTFEETLNDPEWKEYNDFYPDYDREMVNEALENGKITVYSSYPIQQGTFVTPSKMEAMSYSGTGKVYEKTVPLSSVAWIDPTQGQYAFVENDKKLSVKYSEREYSYEELTAKPDMKVTEIDDSATYTANSETRKQIVSQAIKNAASVGYTNENGNAVVHVKDIDTDVILTKKSLVHGLDRRMSTQAPVLVKIGEVLENAIKINEMLPRAENIKSTYALISSAYGKDGNIYAISFIVNKYSNEISEIDVLYAANAKKESAALLPKFTDKSATPTDSTISISQLLETVNRYFPDILPESVLRRFGHEARPDGTLGQSALYSERYGKSKRQILAEALQEIAETEKDNATLKIYREGLKGIDAQQEKLNALRKNIRDVIFSKGSRSPHQRRMLNQAKAEAKQIAAEINKYDVKLLRLESTEPIQQILSYERKKAVKAQRENDLAVLKEYRSRTEDRYNQTVEKYRKKLKDKNEKYKRTVQKYQEARRKNVEGRKHTEFRNKLKHVISEINSLMIHGTKERNVKIPLQPAIKEALTIGEQLFSEGGDIRGHMAALATVYRSLQDSTEYFAQQAYNNDLYTKLDGLQNSLPFGDDITAKGLTLKQLEEIYKTYRAIYKTITNANKLFRQEKAEYVDTTSRQVIQEIDAIPRSHRKNEIMDFGNKFLWSNLKPIVAMDKIGSETFKNLYWDLIGGEGKYGVDIKEATEFLSAQRKEFGYNGWNMDEEYTFTLESGKEITLAKGKIMSLYAYSKRDQALPHLGVDGAGGIVLDADFKKRKNENGKKEWVRVNTEPAYRLSRMDIETINKCLTDAQKGYAEAMQGYLSKVMGEKGNEVSRTLYGIDLFGEEFYFPLKSSKSFLFEKNIPATEISLENTGITKETKPGANNPIVLSDFDTVWIQHVEKMSMYHSLTLPIKNINKVLNFAEYRDGVEAVSVKSSLNNAFGTVAQDYVKKLVQDLNGRVNGTTIQNLVMRQFSKMKKVSVLGSASVVAQQEFAIIRAMSMIHPNYFYFGKKNDLNHSQLWAEIKEYAPIAIIKEIGGFDAGSGRSSTDYLDVRSRDGIKNKVKDFFADSRYRDEIFSRGAGFMDEVGWNRIWMATKRETAVKYPKLTYGSKDFLKICGKRFTEVIVYTQVYDSTLSRSGMMRENSDVMKMATSFMGEPTTAINMMYNAILQVKRGKISKFQAGRTIASVLLANIASAMAASIPYALRDDDEDESLTEKYIEALTEKLFGNKFVGGDLNPLNWIPFLRDINSLISGWDVERADMTLFEELIHSVKNMFSDDVALNKKIIDFVGATGDVCGIPLTNLIRYATSCYNLWNGLFDNNFPEDLSDAAWRGFSGEKKSKNKGIYNSYLSGNKERIDEIRNSYNSESAYDASVASALRQEDERIRKTAFEILNGNHTATKTTVNEIVSEGHFDRQIVTKAIHGETESLKRNLQNAAKAMRDGQNGAYKQLLNNLTETYHGIISKKEIESLIRQQQISETDETEQSESRSIYKTWQINDALEIGDYTTANEIIADIVSGKIEQLKEDDPKLKDKEAEKKAKTSIRSALTRYWKPLYMAACKTRNMEEQSRIRKALMATKIYGNSTETMTEIRKWIAEALKEK